MHFLFPAVLWGLLALAIPIIIHLFHFRRYKRVYFTNVKFLQELKDERSANRKLRNFLILLMRCLAIAALVFAFAQPFLGEKNKSVEQKLVSVFVDNSFSMTSMSSDVPLIDKAKKRATEIVDLFAETDRFQVLSHNYTGVSSKILDKEDALAAIDQIPVTSRVKPLNTILQKQIETFKDEEGDKSFFMLSDFQKSITDLEPITDTTYNVSLVPFQGISSENVSIDSAYFTTPVALINQNNQLIVKLTNHGDQQQDDISLSVIQNGQKKPAGSFSIGPQSSLKDTVALTFLKAGDIEIQLNIQDYPIQFDDTYYLATSIDQQTEVLSIYGGSPNKYVKSLFQSTPEIKLTQTSANNLDYSKFQDQSLIILEDLNTISSGLGSELEQYIAIGGNVVIFPSAQASLTDYNAFLSKMQAPQIANWEATDQVVFDINTDEFVFSKVYIRKKKDAALPAVSGHYRFQKSSSKSGETLLSYRSGEAFVSKYLRGQGHLYVCHAPLDRKHSELVEYAEVFVPMIYKMTFAKGADIPLAYTIGQSSVLSVPNSKSADAVFSVKNQKNEFIPQQSNTGALTEIKIKEEIQDDGFYQILSDETQVRKIAFNYDRIESQPEIYTSDELIDKFSSSYNVYNAGSDNEFLSKLKHSEEGIFLWKWFLIFALIFLAIETLIIRLWK